MDLLWKRGDYSKLTEDERSALDGDFNNNKDKKYGIGAPLTGWTSALFAAKDPRVPLPVLAGGDGRRSSSRQAAGGGGGAGGGGAGAATGANSAGTHRREIVSMVVDQLGDEHKVDARSRDRAADHGAVPA